MPLPSLDSLSERRVSLLVILFGLLVYIPFAGSYGLHDPWETHYAEVARQMAVRGDYISLWWPGAPIDPDHFWSKPVLSFWLMSLSLLAFGLGHPASGTLALSTRAEWAVRMPFVLFGVLGIYAVYLCVSRFVSRRAGVLAAVVTATSPLYALVVAPGDDRHGVRRADDDGAGAGRAGAVRRRGHPAAAPRGPRRQAQDHLAATTRCSTWRRAVRDRDAAAAGDRFAAARSGRSPSAATPSRFPASW